MQNSTAKRWLVFVPPAVILAVAIMVMPYLNSLPPTRLELAQLAPYALSILGISLALHFHRGRPIFAFLILISFYWCYRTYLFDGITGLVRQSIHHAFALLVPANFLLVALMRERGIFSAAGRTRMLFLGLQTFTVYWVFRHHFVDIEPFVTKKFIHLQILDNPALPQPVLLFALLCIAAIGIVASIRQSPIESGLFGAACSLSIASAGMASGDVAVAFCSSGALIMTISILQDTYNMAFRDDLTRIPSRRALNESTHGLGRTYTIAMVDIDHFKQFNDTYGHDVGDQVLKLVAKKLMGVGGGGKAFRYGGEEFTILFARKKAAEALPHLEELRKTIADYPLTIRSSERPADKREGKRLRGNSRGDTRTSVTVSIGVAESGEEAQTAEQVIKAADKALYKAKNRGRNQVCH